MPVIAAQISSLAPTSPQDSDASAYHISKIIDVAIKALAHPHGNESSDLGEASLSILNQLDSEYGICLTTDALKAVAIHADPGVPWTTNESVRLSSAILSRQFTRLDKADFIITTILQETVKPQLHSWQSARLTPAGRIAQFENKLELINSPGLGTVPPWTGDGAQIISLFYWALVQSDVRSLSTCAAGCAVLLMNP